MGEHKQPYNWGTPCCSMIIHAYVNPSALVLTKAHMAPISDKGHLQSGAKIYSHSRSGVQLGSCAHDSFGTSLKLHVPTIAFPKRSKHIFRTPCFTSEGDVATFCYWQMPDKKSIWLWIKSLWSWDEFGQLWNIQNGGFMLTTSFMWVKQ